ncbi:MAG: glycosyl transferase group 1 [Frankiales bacterium]|nr:glycosyl transferase group 1 [Frankiales bacterium]
MRVLVATVVHHPEDARILFREIRALLDAGHQVTYAAPFSDCGVEPWDSLEAVDLPRAQGRSRLKAAAAAGRMLREHADAADVVLLHDIELLLAVRRLGHPCVVWDVHEDNAAAMRLKPWLPAALRPVAAFAARIGERWAEGHLRLILAETGYRSRFRGVHPVVPNTTVVPETVVPPTQARAIYVGSLTFARGLAELIEVGERLAGLVEVELIGPASGRAREALVAAHEAGHVRWLGQLPNDAAVRRMEGAVAGLSLLHDTPNYRKSQPTKVIEYMAYGVPVVTTPLPEPAALVEKLRCGLVVPFDDAAAAAQAVLRLWDDKYLAGAMGARGHAAALADHDWRTAAPAFVRQLERWVILSAPVGRGFDARTRTVASTVRAD